MPRRTYVAKHEKKGFKASKDRVTLLLCSNAAGDKVMKPLLISKSLKPRALIGVDRNALPVHFRANKKAWMTSSMFSDWFHNDFIPEVKEYLSRIKFDFKVILLIDNAPGHTPNLDHPNVKVIFLPPNTTSLIQPLDQGIIACFKSYYIKHSFKYILEKIEAHDDLNIMLAWKSFTLKQCIDCINKSVLDLKEATLRNCWKAIWDESLTIESDNDPVLSTYADIFEIAADIGGEGFINMDVLDLNDLLFELEPISDSEILSCMEQNQQNSETGDIIEVEDENNNEMLTLAKLKQGIAIAHELENHFFLNDNNEERSAKFRRDLKETINCYKIELDNARQKIPQKLMTDFFKK